MTTQRVPPAGGTHRPMRIALLGTNNKMSPLDLRERLAFSPHELGPALEAMKAYVPEGTILSTCHRVELYAAAPSLRGVRAALKRFWSEQRHVSRRGLDEHLYYLEDEQAVAHLFSVASGMDSAIIGEPQILGQVRGALDLSLEHHATGSVLSGLVRQALTVGKRIRTETGISRNAASISSAAVELARDTFGDLRTSRVLLIGTGKMGELAARNLLSKGVAGFSVAGRTPARTRQLALECGSAVALTELEQALPQCDIVISCTSAPHHVISREMVEQAMRERSGQPLFLIDIAVPRDVEPSAGDVEGVRLFNIDDLEATVRANVRERWAEAPKASAIIDESVAAFDSWLVARRAVPTIAALRKRAESIRQTELARTSAVLARLSEADRRRIEALTLALQKKLLHQSIALLRAEAVAGNGRATDRAVRQLFSLDSTRA
jgi:glutamyl-tRNA reductase